MSANPTNLNEILKLAREMHAQNMRTLAVFDLDSTLFNVSTRSQKILHEFAETHQHEVLKNIEVHPTDWGIKEALLRNGYTLEKDIELLKKIRDFWSERFFSNEYIHYDVPYTGAITFVQELEKCGVEIQYLTGRDHQRMRKGSVEVLKKWGFPLQNETDLHMKPEKSQDDELYKFDWFKKLDTKPYSQIYFFENEPININAVLDLKMQVHVVYLDTTHSRKQSVSNDIMTIKGYERSSSC